MATGTANETLVGQSIPRLQRVSIRFFFISCWDAVGCFLKAAPNKINGSIGGAVRAVLHKLTEGAFR